MEIEFRGTARAIREITTEFGPAVQLRVEVTDATGNVAEILAVEVESDEARGQIVEGDQVEGVGARDEDGLVRARELRVRLAGRSGGLVIRGDRHRTRLRWVLGFAVVPFLAAALGYYFEGFPGLAVGWVGGMFAAIFAVIVVRLVSTFER